MFAPMVRSILAIILISATSASSGGEPGCSQYILKEKHAWTLIRQNAEWPARDSHEAYIVNGSLRIFGGWVSSYSAALRDVWESGDGESWNNVTTNTISDYGDFPKIIFAFDRYWMISGWKDGRLDTRGASNEIWSSSDGNTWAKAANGTFSPRVGSSLVYFNDKLWLIGGTEDYFYGSSATLKNDVWSSRDGINWQLEVQNASWSPRAYMNAVVFGGKIWLIGGGNYKPDYLATNDIWSSSDGKTWIRASANAGWEPRIWASAVQYRGALWFMGGWADNPYRNFNDVWYSVDGAHWNRADFRDIWDPRHAMSALVFQDKIFIAGGNTESVENDVWSLFLPLANPFQCAE